MVPTSIAWPSSSTEQMLLGTPRLPVEDNDCSGTGRAGIFAGFMLNGVVTRNPDLINTNKYLQASGFTAQIDAQSLSSGFDYDNPVLDHSTSKRHSTIS